MGCIVIKKTQKETRASEEFKLRSTVAFAIPNQLRMKKKGLFMVNEVTPSLEISTYYTSLGDCQKIQE